MTCAATHFDRRRGAGGLARPHRDRRRAARGRGSDADRRFGRRADVGVAGDRRCPPRGGGLTGRPPGSRAVTTGGCRAALGRPAASESGGGMGARRAGRSHVRAACRRHGSRRPGPEAGGDMLVVVVVCGRSADLARGLALVARHIDRRHADDHRARRAGGEPHARLRSGRKRHLLPVAVRARGRGSEPWSCSRRDSCRRPPTRRRPPRRFASRS